MYNEVVGLEQEGRGGDGRGVALDELGKQTNPFASNSKCCRGKVFAKSKMEPGRMWRWSK